MAESVVLFIAHQGHITAEFLSKFQKYLILFLQVPVKSTEESFIVTINSQLMADSFG